MKQIFFAAFAGAVLAAASAAHASPPFMDGYCDKAGKLQSLMKTLGWKHAGYDRGDKSREHWVQYDKSTGSNNLVILAPDKKKPGALCVRAQKK